MLSGPWMQLLVPEHTFFFLLRAGCTGGLVARLLGDGDGSDKACFPAQAFLLLLLLQVLQDVLSSLMGTWHSSGRKWLLLGGGENKHSLKLLRCTQIFWKKGFTSVKFSNPISKHIRLVPAEQRFTRRILGNKPAISFGANLSQETPHEPVQTK